MPLASVLAPVGSIDLSAFTENAAIVSADTIPYYDTSVGASRKVTVSDFSAAVLSGTTTWKGFGVEGLVVQSQSSSTLSITATRAVVEDSNGLVRRLDNVSETVDITVSGAGGLANGTEASGTWYYIWLVSDSGSNVAGILSTSATAPTMPVGYTFRRLLGVVRNNAGGDFEPFVQYGNSHWLTELPSSGNFLTVTNSGTPVGVQTTSMSTQVPPVAKSWFPSLTVTNSNSNDFGSLSFYIHGSASSTEIARFDFLPAISGSKPSNTQLTVAPVPLVVSQTLFWQIATGSGTPQFTLTAACRGFTL